MHIAANRGNWNINLKTLHEPAVYYNYALHYITYLLKPHTPFFHSFPCTSAFKMHLTTNAFLYITNLNWRNHWSVKTSLQLSLSSTQKKPAFSNPASSTKGPHTSQTWRNHWFSWNKPAAFVVLHIEETSLFKTCFVHKRPTFLQQAAEIKMKTLNHGGCFKRLWWFDFQSRILLAIISDG